MDRAKIERDPIKIAEILHEETQKQLHEKLGKNRPNIKFIPYFSMHEFESLLFSDPTILANELGIKSSEIMKILQEFKDPEKINNSYNTSPSHRLIALCAQNNSKYLKNSLGIDIAGKIGINTMRKQCRVFNNWLERIENLAKHE